MKRFLLSIICAAVCLTAGAQDIKYFKLNNGMSVYIWEDHTKPDVFGEVVVRTGSANDPEEYTGLAHYLEHVMFKGTQKIGTLDWEKEAPIYEEIIAAYDEMAQTDDPAKKSEISAHINELTVAASKYSATNEFANLTESIGAAGLNAATSYDQTFYYSIFPASQTSNWLQLNAERFKDPVFRAFQSELETVYEEYNISRDNPSSLESEFMLSKIFEGSPYARPVIGKGEHLKNPRLSKLIEFYQTWYVPSNMALILAGDVDAKSITRLINATFGRLTPGTAPETQEYPGFTTEKRTQYTIKYGQYPSVVLAFDGVKSGSPDEIALDICLQVLNNSYDTGILDQMCINNDIMSASAGSISFRHQGRILIEAIPYYDEAQGRYDSSKKVEKLLSAAVQKVVDGTFDPWVIESIKTNTCRDFDLALEDNETRASLLQNIFVSEADLAEELAYKERVMAITLDDVKRVAKQYLGGNCIVIFNEVGKPEKQERIEKPDYDPITPEVGRSSEYAQWFKALPAPEQKAHFVEWDEVQERQINSYSRLYYTPAKDNEVFSLVLKYGANSTIFPKLKYAASLMNNAGILASYTPEVFKKEMSRLGATCNIFSDNDYLYVSLRGYENTLKESCTLLTKLMLMPALDKDQLDNVRSSALMDRIIRKNNPSSVASALREYIMYGEDSNYRKEATDRELLDLDISKLTGSIVEATHYAAEVHYCGRLPFDKVYDILSTSLPLVDGEKPSSSPKVRRMKDYTENTVFFVNNSEGQQSQIYFYVPMGEYNKEDEVLIDAFNRYFDGDFNGLVMQEIREFNSMAYSAYGQVGSSKLPGSNMGLIGYIGTQHDKAIGAIELYMKLLQEMPERPENIDNIRKYLTQMALTGRPDDRSVSQQIAEWKLEGYSEDPAKAEVAKIAGLEFEDILKFYKEKIQGRPIIIGIVGNPKYISTKELSKFGKVTRISPAGLYNDKDVLF